jgi:Spy/CpxP family protein refolding chaperone
MRKREWGNKTRTWMMAGVMLLSVAAASAAQAQQPVGPPGPPPRGQGLLTPDDRAAMAQIFWHRAQERLALTDQQVTEIRGLLEAQRATTRTDVQSLIAARKQLRSLLDQPTADQAAIQTAATQIKTTQDKLFDSRLQTQIALRAKLTPAQWQQWRTLRQGMGQRGWMRHRGGFGGGMM